MQSRVVFRMQTYTRGLIVWYFYVYYNINSKCVTAEEFILHLPVGSAVSSDRAGGCRPYQTLEPAQQGCYIRQS